MDFVEFSKQMIAPQIIAIVAKEYDIDYEESAELLNHILYFLYAGLIKNIQDPERVEHLDDALSSDHDGALLVELEDYFQGKEIDANQDTLNSEGILEHLLLHKENQAIKLLHEILDIDEKIIQLCLYQMAPVALGILWQLKKETGFSIESIEEYLRKSLETKKESWMETIDQYQQFFSDEEHLEEE